MHFDIFPNTLGLAILISFTLNDSVFALGVMDLSIFIGQYLITPQICVVAREFQILDLFFYLALTRNELGLLAHHRTLTSLSAELIEAGLMISVLALLAFHGID